MGSEICFTSSRKVSCSLVKTLIFFKKVSESELLDTDVSESINSSTCKGSLFPDREELESELEDSMSRGAILERTSSSRSIS